MLSFDKLARHEAETRGREPCGACKRWPSLSCLCWRLLMLRSRKSRVVSCASIHEEATYSVNVPFMPVFNNLVIYKQDVAQNSLESIVPELADSWAWSGDNKTLNFKLHQGVKWHDGKPFTSNDVKCTFDMLMGKSQQK